MENTIAVMDKQGRLYIPKRIKRPLESRFFVVKVDSKLILIPVPKNPAKDLEELGKGLPKKTVEEMKKEIQMEMAKEL